MSPEKPGGPWWAPKSARSLSRRTTTTTWRNWATTISGAQPSADPPFPKQHLNRNFKRNTAQLFNVQTGPKTGRMHSSCFPPAEDSPGEKVPGERVFDWTWWQLIFPRCHLTIPARSRILTQLFEISREGEEEGKAGEVGSFRRMVKLS